MIALTENRKSLLFPKLEISYLEPRPAWWKVRPEEIMETCRNVRKGRSEIIAETPGGFPVYAVFYGTFDDPAHQTNWSAGSASGKPELYTGSGPRPQTVLWCSGIHGAEAESVAAACGGVFDAIYNPRETLLARYAKKHGVPCVTGMEMLVRQAAEAQTIWQGLTFDEDEIKTVIDMANSEMEKR